MLQNLLISFSSKNTFKNRLASLKLIFFKLKNIISIQRQKLIDQKNILADTQNLENQLKITEYNWQKSTKDLESLYQINQYGNFLPGPEKNNLQNFLVFIKRVNELSKPRLKLQILTSASEKLTIALNQKSMDLVDKKTLLFYQKILILSLEKIYFELTYWKLDKKYNDTGIRLKSIKKDFLFFFASFLKF